MAARILAWLVWFPLGMTAAVAFAALDVIAEVAAAGRDGAGALAVECAMRMEVW